MVGRFSVRTGRRDPGVVIAAIIIANSQNRENEARCQSSARTGNWGCADLLGQSVLGRIVDGLKVAGVDSVFAFAAPHASRADDQTLALDTWRAAALRFAMCKQEGVESVIIASAGAYAEFDLAAMLAFHKEEGQAVSRVVAADGPVDLWLVDPSRFGLEENLEKELYASDCAYYELRGYVNRLNSAGDFRRLVLDSFSSRCRLRPRGVELRPGVWMAENAEIGRGARIVAPAFIGQGVKIGDDCLITRGSNVEHGSEIDFGTAVEDSSILQKTYLGIGLDLSHSIADGRILWNLRHEVSLEITDPVVMRPNIASKRERRPWGDFEEDGFRLSAQGASQ